MTPTLYATQKQACEWAFCSGKSYDDPFNEIELDVEFTGPAGRTLRVPTYWAGEKEWRVRFAAPTPGEYTYRAACSDTENPSLHNQTGRLIVSPYEGDNPLLLHGPLRVDATRRYLEHADGTPFFWLGDIWWLGLTSRLDWPDGFQMLTADRAAKGFSTALVVAGLPPDMPAYDPRGFNEAGHPWEPEYARINPAYFDMMDLRIHWLVRQGLVPCILGAWGFYLPWMGLQKTKQHWRYLVARYGAYPAIWCLAGTAAMPYYLSTDREREAALQKKGWTEVARYVREIDPIGHPITVHPVGSARSQLEDETLLDIDMLHGGHGGYESIKRGNAAIRASLEREPTMPTIVGEMCFEGSLAINNNPVQRIAFWASILSGAKGFTYGANGIWQFNTPEDLFGPSAVGRTWGNRPWMEAARLPGSTHVGIGKRLLERYPWWRFEAHSEWLNHHADDENPLGPYAAGTPLDDETPVRVIYLPLPAGRRGDPLTVLALNPEATYCATYYDPINGDAYDQGTFTGCETWPVPGSPALQDWVLVIGSVQA